MIAEGRRFDTGKLVIYLLVSLFASLSLFPFYWSALLATQDTRSIMGMSLRFGSHLLENYRGWSNRCLSPARCSTPCMSPPWPP